MQIYNTATRKKEEFQTLEPNKVKMYVCGPTVYNYIHIGNARPYVAFDTIRRYLEYKGYKVDYIQNFTDVDDKIIKRAFEEKTSFETICNKYIEETIKDSEGLNVKAATFNPRVSAEMDSIIAMIDTLITKGFAYEKNSTVYFNTDKFEGYGKLSGKNPDDLKAGARVEINTDKQNPLDFVLWKPFKAEFGATEPRWESPWGAGRPGWHIECSAMCKKYLGDTIDIHAGGEDLVFPHHENEIAQSEAANGKPFVKYWLHNGFINVDNQKMSKSKGNFFTLREIAEKFPYEVIRFFILNGHYRSPINFSAELLEASQNGLNRIKNCLFNLQHLINTTTNEILSNNEKSLMEDILKYKLQFEKSMDDDFNTADAITAIYELVKFCNINVNEHSSKEFASQCMAKIDELCDILGILTTSKSSTMNDVEIQDLINERQEARKLKDWALADKIRNQLTEMGITLEDTPNGVRYIVNR